MPAWQGFLSLFQQGKDLKGFMIKYLYLNSSTSFLSLFQQGKDLKSKGSRQIHCRVGRRFLSLFQQDKDLKRKELYYELRNKIVSFYPFFSRAKT